MADIVFLFFKERMMILFRIIAVFPVLLQRQTNINQEYAGDQTPDLSLVIENGES